MNRPFLTTCVGVLLLGASPLGAQQTGADLAAASNLSQGRQQDVLRLADALGVNDFRDGMVWNRAERRPGQYRFNDLRLDYPDDMAAFGAEVSIVLNWGNDLYDDGATPYSDAAIDAFGAFAGRMAERFENMTALEIGNEFNGTNFVRGPIAQMAPLDRARAYVPLLKSAATAARAVRPDLEILGGATHSIPAGYLWAMLDAGAADAMDALAIHPYTTPTEQLVPQIGVLRRHPDAADMPLQVTEFGHPDPERAGAHFVMQYCQLSLAGVTRTAWYPLNERGDGMVPLFRPNGRITTAGEAYRLIAAEMEGRLVTDAAPDPFTYACRFEGGALVIWGAERPVDVPEGATVLDATGAELSPPYEMWPDQPLVIVGLTEEEMPALGAQQLVADSYHQFAYPEDTEARAAGDGFERFALRDGEEIALVTLPGQEARGTLWNPYRGNPDLGAVRLTAEQLLPGGWRDRPVDVVHRYRSDTAQTVRLVADAAPAKRSADGIAVRVSLNGEVLEAQAGKDRILIERADLALEPGDEVTVSVGPNGSSDGDVTRYRITLHRQ